MEEQHSSLGRQILRELEAIAMARATDFLSVRNGALEITDTDRLPKEAAAAIASVEKTSTGLRVKLYDKLKALELLGKCMGLFDGAAQPAEDTGLLQAIINSTKEDLFVNDISELQQTAADGHDLVE